MLSKKLNDELNNQIKFEFYSSHLYLAMAAKLESLDFSGVSKYMKVQAEEERSHAMKIFEYVIERGGTAVVYGFEDPHFKAVNLLEMLEEAYGHEQLVTARIYKLMNIAQEEKDYMSINFLNWFVNEQLEEESNADELVKKVRLIGNDGNGLYQLDKELGTRVFTPPTE